MLEIVGQVLAPKASEVQAIINPKLQKFPARQLHLELSIISKVIHIAAKTLKESNDSIIPLGV